MTYERKLTAILSCQIPDFTDMLASSEDRALALMRKRNSLMKSLIGKHHGTLMRALDQTYLACFDSAVSAVQCALEAQKAFAEVSRQRDAEPLNTRTCVYLGEVVTEEGEILVSGVDLAPNMLTLVRPRRVGITREVLGLVRGKVGVGFSRVGDCAIKGFNDPVEVFQDVVDPALERQEPATPARPSVPLPKEAPRKAAEADDPAAHGIELRPAASSPPQLGKPKPAPKTRQPDADGEEAALRRLKGIAENTEKKPSGPMTDVVLMVNHPSLMFSKMGGMTVIERQLFMLAQAGVKRVCSTSPPPAKVDVSKIKKPKGLEVIWDAKKGRGLGLFDPPYVGMSQDYLLEPDILRWVLNRPHKKDMSYQDPAQIGDPHAGKGVIQVIPFRRQRIVRYETKVLPEDACALLEIPPDKGAGMRWLFSRARKSQDSFMARHFDRRISLAVTKRLINVTWIHPNHMTVFSSLIGLAGAALFAEGSFPFMLAGALVFWLHTVLDGCDGEMARIRMQTSRLGGTLDFWGDNVVHFALFLCMGAGLYRATGSALYPVLAFVAAASALASAFAVYQHSKRRTEREGGVGPFFKGLDDLAGKDAPKEKPGFFKRAAARVEHVLSQRDFVYLVVLLALLGRLDIFLIAAGIGTPLFLVVFLLLSQKS